MSKANANKPATSSDQALTVTIGGKERELRYNVGAFTVSQVRYKIRLPVSALTDPTIGDMVIILWIGLLTHYPRLDLATVTGWIEGEKHPLFKTYQRVAPAFSRALREFGVPDQEEEEEAEVSLEDMLAPLE